MSRTDVHRPGWVQERDPANRRHIEIHHVHWEEERFPCTHEPRCLPGRWETEPTHLVRREAACEEGVKFGRCRPYYRGGRNIYCGCRLCTSHYEQRAERRRDRHHAKAELRKVY